MNENSKSQGMMDTVKGFLSKSMILVALVVLCIIMGCLSTTFFTASNWLNILVQSAINGIIAVGMTFVIITGGIDLSVGSILAFSAVVGGLLLEAGIPVAISVLVSIIIGSAAGFINGFFITKFKMPAFIVTLAMMEICRGLTMVVTNGENQSLTPDSSLAPKLSANYTAYSIFGGSLGGVFPVPIIIMFIVIIIGYYLLKYTTFGRGLYAIGGNREASKFSGIKVGKLELLAYTITGLLCGIAGIVLNSRLGAAIPTAGEGYEMDAIGAVVIGGASLAGGEGSMGGTLIGVLILSVLNNGLNLMNVNSFYQDVVKGLVILVAVLIDMLRKKNK